MPRLRSVFAVVLASSMSAAAPPAASASFSDPSSNFYVNPTCSTATDCLQQASGILDQARIRLGQPAYGLPGNFAQLPPPEQAFVLTNLDRLLYGLTPITGLTSDLDQAATAAARLDADPMVSGSDIATVTSNWGGGYSNLPLAYEAWMYDDGPGGVNLDCTALNSSQCWDHRHNILWPMSGDGPLAMGAAAGTDAHGTQSYAMLIVQGDSSYHPTYVYTWSQVVAAGGGAVGTRARSSSVSVAPAGLDVTLLRRGARSISFKVLGPPGAQPTCSLRRLKSGRWLPDRSGRCGTVTTYARLDRGRYRLRARAGAQTTTRYVSLA